MFSGINDDRAVMGECGTWGCGGCDKCGGCAWVAEMQSDEEYTLHELAQGAATALDNGVARVRSLGGLWMSVGASIAHYSDAFGTIELRETTTGWTWIRTDVDGERTRTERRDCFDEAAGEAAYQHIKALDRARRIAGGNEFTDHLPPARRVDTVAAGKEF